MQNEELFESVCAELRDTAQHEIKVANYVSAIASATLASQDRTLTDLNDISRSARVYHEGIPDLEALTDRAERLTRALQLFQAEALKDRLDRVYLESLDSVVVSADNYGDPSAAETDLETINEEMSSLYAEIDDVAKMVAVHEHGSTLRALLQSIRQARTQGKRTIDQKVRPFPFVLPCNPAFHS